MTPGLLATIPFNIVGATWKLILERTFPVKEL